jgi:hypothetical protein
VRVDLERDGDAVTSSPTTCHRRVGLGR